jgi:hypothetical protein
MHGAQRNRPRDAIHNDIAPKGGGWKNDSGCHRRSLADSMMFRLKQVGDSLYSRTFARQVSEVHVRPAIINTFTDPGVPQTVRAGGQVALAV